MQELLQPRWPRVAIHHGQILGHKSRVIGHGWLENVAPAQGWPKLRVSRDVLDDGVEGHVNVNAKKLQAMPIPLPTIPEQHRIVAHLNDVQTQVAALRRTQEVTASELERLERAILMQAFRGEL